MPFPKFQNSSRANSANLLRTGQELRTARKDEDSPDLLIAAKVANPSANPEPDPREGGEFSNPISRISKGLAEPTTGGLSCPGRDKPEEFSRLATLADSPVQTPTRDPDPLAALELVHALLSKSTDTLTQGAENAFRTEQTTVSAHTDTALTVTDTTPPASVSVSAPSVHTLTVTNAVQDEENSSSVSASVHFLSKEVSNPWVTLLEVADQLAHRLWELQAPVVRVDINGRAVGYQSLEALNLEETRSLLRWLCATLEREYPKPEGIVSVLAQWPGRWPEKTRNLTLIQLEGGCLAI